MGFEPTISAGKRLRTYALDRAATGTGVILYYTSNFSEEIHEDIVNMAKTVQGNYLA